MNEQFFILSDKEKREKRKALEVLTAVDAMPLEQVPEIFFNPKDTVYMIPCLKAAIDSRLDYILYWTN